MNRLVWTKEIPQKEGWYFTRVDGVGRHLRVVHVHKRPKGYLGEGLLCIGYTKYENGAILKELSSERLWAGIIEEPKPYISEEERKNRARHILREVLNELEKVGISKDRIILYKGCRMYSFLFSEDDVTEEESRHIERLEAILFDKLHKDERYDFFVSLDKVPKDNMYSLSGQSDALKRYILDEESPCK